MSRLSNLSSGLIGAVVGAAIGIAGTLLVTYINLFLDIAVDDEAAKKELFNASQVLSSYKSIASNDSVPKYKLLNSEIEWKTVLVDVDDVQFSEMYFQLINLDTLRELIINTSEKEEKLRLIAEYKEGVFSLSNNINFEEQINKIDKVMNNRFE